MPTSTANEGEGNPEFSPLAAQLPRQKLEHLDQLTKPITLN